MIPDQGPAGGGAGRLDYREWKDKDDNPHSKHEVIADQVEFEDPKDPSSNGSAPTEHADAAGEEPF